MPHLTASHQSSVKSGMTPNPVLNLDSGIFGQLRRDCGVGWTDYVAHPFVRALGDGSLAREKFQKYLIQDYLFLVQYSRAYALLAYKLDNMADMRSALQTATALLAVELPLHVQYCAGWAIAEPEMAAATPTLELLAYTRFVLELGSAGDSLDLMVALAPCIIGYAEIGAALSPHVHPDNPYAAWIQMYSGAEYAALAEAAISQLDELGARRGAAARYDSLLASFKTATMLETAFWEMAWR